MLVAIGNSLTGPGAQHELKEFVERVERALPNLQCHRLIVSYSWLLLATFKVCIHVHVPVSMMKDTCVSLFVFIQVLGAAKRLTDSMQEQIWAYFSQTMVPCITKYQMQCIESQQQLTKEDIEELLIQGVDGVETSRVSV